MNNGNVKLTDGSKPKVAKNTLGKTPVSIFAGLVRSMRLNRKQRLLLQRQAILRRELNGFSNHMFDDLGMTSDIASTSDITGIALLTGSEFINTLSNSVNLNDNNCSLLHRTPYENQSAVCRLKAA